VSSKYEDERLRYDVLLSASAYANVPSRVICLEDEEKEEKKGGKSQDKDESKVDL